MNIFRIRNEMRNGKTIFDLPLRVTFYARVSTDKDEQLNSLENQVQHYTELIQSKPNWTYIEGYIDEGISGTSTKKRGSFNRMIRNVKARQFDFIITKEISRFSRSTLDSDSEFRLVVMAGVTQDDAQDIRRIEEDLSAIQAKKGRLLEMSIESVISMTEFKQRNDGFNEQVKVLEGKMAALQAEAERGRQRRWRPSAPLWNKS